MKITPEKDEIASYQRKAKGATTAPSDQQIAPTTASSSATLKTIVFIAVLAALAALGWAVLLHNDFIATERQLAEYQQRINQLEERLSMTDAGIDASTEVIDSRVRELDTEIRKLWDNVWKRSRERFTEHEQQLQQHTQSIDNTNKQLAQLTGQLAEIRQLNAAEAAQRQRLTRLADDLEATDGKLNQLDMRVTETEGWVDSVNSFRKQVNSEINTLKQQVNALQ